MRLYIRSYWQPPSFSSSLTSGSLFTVCPPELKGLNFFFLFFFLARLSYGATVEENSDDKSAVFLPADRWRNKSLCSVGEKNRKMRGEKRKKKVWACSEWEKEMMRGRRGCEERKREKGGKKKRTGETRRWGGGGARGNVSNYILLINPLHLVNYLYGWYQCVSCCTRLWRRLM